MSDRKCADCREMISALVDGELSPRERVELRAHLATCRDCQAVLESYRVIGERIRLLPPVHAPEHLTDSIFARTIDAEPGRMFLITSRVGYSMAAVAAVALIFVVAGYLIMGGYQRAIQPAVASSAPPAATDALWPVHQPIEIEFNKAMNEESVLTALALEPSGELERLGTQWRGNTLILGMNQTLRPDTVYRIKISSDARDEWGNRLDPSFSLQFTTAPTVAVFQTPTPPPEEPTQAMPTPTPTSLAPVVAPTEPPRSTARPSDPGPSVSTTVPQAPVGPTARTDDTPATPDDRAPVASPTPTPEPTNTPVVSTDPPTPTPTTSVAPTATPTPSPTPSATPTSPPTATMAPSATPTTAQPTQTPTPTATATPDTVAVTGAIGNLYWGDEFVRERLGPALDVSTTTAGQVQGFQRGTMVLRSDTATIYVLSSDGRWSSFPDGATTLEDAQPGPEPGLWRPGGQFGWLWHSNSDTASELGFATSEHATHFTVSTQMFANGLVLVGVDSIYVIYFDGLSTWEFYPNIP